MKHAVEVAVVFGEQAEEIEELLGKGYKFSATSSSVEGRDRVIIELVKP